MNGGMSPVALATSKSLYLLFVYLKDLILSIHIGWLMVFTGGYLGMQRNSITERRILFSIWDVGKGNTVDLVEKGDNVTVKGFGGEGTCAQSFKVYDWKAGDTVYFKVTTDVDEAKNASTLPGYYSIDEGKNWILMATFLGNKQKNYIASPYGFLENSAQIQLQLRKDFMEIKPS